MYFSDLHEERMQRFIQEKGLAGIGAYTVVALALECLYDGAARYGQLRTVCRELFRQKRLDQVLKESGLFVKGPDEKYRRALPALGPEGMPAPMPAAWPARDKENIKREEKNRKETSCCPPQQKQDIPEDFYKYRDYEWFPYVYQLAQPETDKVWWESLCMKATNWSSMLARHRRDLFLFYMEHLVTLGHDNRLHGENDVKFHLANLLLKKNVSDRLKEHLLKLEEDEAYGN